MLEIDTSADQARLAGQFNLDGFVRLPRLCDDAELIRLTEVFDQFFSRELGAASIRDLVGARGSKEPAKLAQVLLPEREMPELLDGDFLATAKSWASVLLDTPETQLEYFGNLILKPAYEESATPWHQDEAYFLPSDDPRWRRRSVTIWMPLSDATLDNGCLHYVAGSHRGRVLPHRHAGGDDDVEGLEAETPPHDRAVPCPVPAGHATAHDVRTLHYAGPNRTGQARRAYVHLFGGRKELDPDPRPRP